MRAKKPALAGRLLVRRQTTSHTTHEESLSRAKDVARDWYLGLLGKFRAGELKAGKTFREAAERFIDEFETITEGERSPTYVDAHKDRIKNHLNPFFGDMVVSEITAGKIQDYRIHRMKNGMSRVDQIRKAKMLRQKDAPKIRTPETASARHLHQEIVCLRQILKAANRHGWLEHLPNLSAPFQAPARSRTAPGSRRKNTSSSTPPRGQGSTNPT